MLKREIVRLKEEIAALGAVHPGRMTRQYNVCGTPGCHCKDSKNPQKHGPYHYLSYTFCGKGRTLFIPQECVAEMERRTENYVRLRQLVRELVERNIELARKEVLHRGKSK